MAHIKSILRGNKLGYPLWMYTLAWLPILYASTCDPLAPYPSTANKTNHNGITIAVAFDYSRSVNGISHGGMLELIQLTDSLLACGISAVVVFDAISSPSEQDLVRLRLQPLIPAAHLPLAQRASVAGRNRALMQKNKQAVLQFLRECRQRISWAILKSSEKQTDLNGFLRKVSIFQQEPSVQGFRHSVFLQSDGDHDILIKRNGRRIRVRRLECPNWADDVRLYVCNWKSTQPCGITRMFGSTQGFFDYYFKHFNA